MSIYPGDPFTYSYYSYIISKLSGIYRFTTFHDGKCAAMLSGQDKQIKDPLVILRHDIDMELDAALSMSLLEKEKGIRATYFFMVRCPIYNVFSASGSEQVKQILASGHHFGLHFDCASYKDISSSKLEAYISLECYLLESFFQQPIEAISFHRPGLLELSGLQLKKWPNSYEKVFREEFIYFSDSRSRWGSGDPLESDAFRERQNMHICIHPVWWGENVVAPIERLTSLVCMNQHRAENYLSENCSVWNEVDIRANIIARESYL